ERRQTPEERSPLGVVEGRVASRLGRQQRRELRAQYEDRAVAALERLAQLEEAPPLVVRGRVVDRPHHREDALVGGGGGIAERRKIGHALLLVGLERAKRLVQCQEDLERQRLA